MVSGSDRNSERRMATKTDGVAVNRTHDRHRSSSDPKPAVNSLNVLYDERGKHPRADKSALYDI